MKIRIEKRGIEVKSISQWPRPKKSNQWKEGRSAWAIANYAMNCTSDFKDMIEDVLSECQIETQVFTCEPEATAGLGEGFGRGGSRNHDLLLKGNKNCVIGIESKVSEYFDEEIGKVISEGKTRAKRALSLIKYLAPEHENESKLKEIGYQLFTATRGTICSSEKENIRNAVFLVIVFTGCVKKEPDYDKRIHKNEKDFNSFLHYLNAQNGMIIREVNGKPINCWIKKKEVEVTKTNGVYTFKYK